MDCFHMRPFGFPEPNTTRKMSDIAKREARYDIQWGVVNSGNASCHSIHRTKKEAEKERREHACAYVVVKVLITPIYMMKERENA